jgi:flagellar basal-body rod protein FlgB
MPMDKINNITDFLKAGIKAETLRQKAISNNIANLQTPGYRRTDVKFEELLAKAMEQAGGADPKNLNPVLYQPKQNPINSNGNDVSLESEIGQMVKNTLRHTTYIRLLNKKYSEVSLAIETNQ